MEPKQEPVKPQAVPRALVRSCNLPHGITWGWYPLCLALQGKGGGSMNSQGSSRLLRSQENHGKETRKGAVRHTTAAEATALCLGR